MLPLRVFCVAISASFFIPTTSQLKPTDFSGSWVIQSGVGGRGYAMVFSGSQMTVTQTNSSITVKRAQGQNPVSIELPLNGVEKAISVPPLLRGRTEGEGAAVFTSRTAWEGKELVVTSVEHHVANQRGPAHDRETKERLTLVEPGFLVIHRTYTEVLGVPQGVVTEQDIYKKASAKRAGR